MIILMQVRISLIFLGGLDCWIRGMMDYWKKRHDFGFADSLFLNTIHPKIHQSIHPLIHFLKQIQLRHIGFKFMRSFLGYFRLSGIAKFTFFKVSQDICSPPNHLIR